MAKTNLPDWRTMTPQDLADLAVEDEVLWWKLYEVNWGDREWHAFKEAAAVLEPRTHAAARERTTPSGVWFERRWILVQ